MATQTENTTYWEIGRHIVEFEQGGETRAAYGKRLLADLADALTREFGKGFDERNLRNMRAFFQHFPIRNALRSELSWTHYRLLLRVESAAARQWYSQEAASQNWSTRVLERQIGSLSSGSPVSSVTIGEHLDVSSATAIRWLRTAERMKLVRRLSTPQGWILV